MLPMSTCAKRDKYTTFTLVKTMTTEEVLTPSPEIVDIFIFYCSSEDSNTLLEERERTPHYGGGGGYFYELLMALYFIFLNNLNTFFKKN